jgi:hypothetical protein
MKRTELNFQPTDTKGVEIATISSKYAIIRKNATFAKFKPNPKVSNKIIEAHQKAYDFGLNINRIIDHYSLDEYEYTLQDLAPGDSIEKISQDDEKFMGFANAPQAIFDKFVYDFALIRRYKLYVDPNPKNFFYDNDKISFIDLTFGDILKKDKKDTGHLYVWKKFKQAKKLKYKWVLKEFYVPSTVFINKYDTKPVNMTARDLIISKIQKAVANNYKNDRKLLFEKAKNILTLSFNKKVKLVNKKNNEIEPNYLQRIINQHINS